VHFLEIKHVLKTSHLSILGEFAKLRKATIRIVMSVRPSVCLHGTTRLPLEGFWWNLIFVFSKIYRENSSLIKIRQEERVLYLKTLHIYGNISQNSSRMWNISNTSSRENQNTHFMVSDFFFPKIASWDTVKKYGRVRQAEPDNTTVRRKDALCMPGL
jgi:hypothetical protein